MTKIAFSVVAGAAAAVSAVACAPMEGVADAEPGRVFPASASLCRAGEQPLFQCQAGARTLALCAGAADGERYVQYRYGSPGNVELAFPVRGMAGLSRATIPFSGGGETQVNFRNGSYGYSVYSRTVRTGFGEGGNNPEFSAGVTVSQGGRELADRGCTAPADATFEAATYDLLPEGQPVMSD